MSKSHIFINRRPICKCKGKNLEGFSISYFKSLSHAEIRSLNLGKQLCKNCNNVYLRP
jgi:hypothetical protein